MAEDPSRWKALSMASTGAQRPPGQCFERVGCYSRTKLILFVRSYVVVECVRRNCDSKLEAGIGRLMACIFISVLFLSIFPNRKLFAVDNYLSFVY